MNKIIFKIFEKSEIFKKNALFSTIFWILAFLKFSIFQILLWRKIIQKNKKFTFPTLIILFSHYNKVHRTTRYTNCTARLLHHCFETRRTACPTNRTGLMSLFHYLSFIERLAGFALFCEFSVFSGFWASICCACRRHRGSCAMPLAETGHGIWL